MSFDNYQHFHNYLANQATEYIHHPQNSLLPCYSRSPLHSWQPLMGFLLPYISLRVVDLQINGIVHDFFHSTQCFEESSILLRTVGHALFWLSSIPFCEYTSLFILSPVEGHLSCFQFEVIMNKASLNFCIQVFV